MTDNIKITVPSNQMMMGLLGKHDQTLKAIEMAFRSCAIVARGNEITISGPEREFVATLFGELMVLLEKGHRIDTDVVRRTIDMLSNDEVPSSVLTTEVLKSSKGGPIRPKTAGQRRYVDAIIKNTVTFGIGPAGTGKSYLAMAVAVQALQAEQVSRIVLTRPAVEAGESLGFLPGDLMAKVDPYLRPLYDALYDLVGTDAGLKLMAKGAIEVAPLAYMRGRTLNSSFIILDEAQNATREQLKMCLTRIGHNSKVVVTGDVTQIDLGGGKSGLVNIEKILGNVEGLDFVYLDEKDVVRHKIVQDIVKAYEQHTNGSKK